MADKLLDRLRRGRGGRVSVFWQCGDDVAVSTGKVVHVGSDFIEVEGLVPTAEETVEAGAPRVEPPAALLSTMVPAQSLTAVVSDVPENRKALLPGVKMRVQRTKPAEAKHAAPVTAQTRIRVMTVPETKPPERKVTIRKTTYEREPEVKVGQTRTVGASKVEEPTAMELRATGTMEPDIQNELLLDEPPELDDDVLTEHRYVSRASRVRQRKALARHARKPAKRLPPKEPRAAREPTAKPAVKRPRTAPRKHVPNVEQASQHARKPAPPARTVERSAGSSRGRSALATIILARASKATPQPTEGRPHSKAKPPAPAPRPKRPAPVAVKPAARAAARVRRTSAPTPTRYHLQNQPLMRLSGGRVQASRVLAVPGGFMMQQR